MPLNKLENFIRNTEGRILYVNPNDLDATDSIDNQGNSLTKPFKTIQRALLESARFSYLRGDNNDLVEKTTILLFPGEHLVDNRPGFAVKDVGGVATAVSPSGSESVAGEELTLTLSSNFDLTQTNNILHKFNSVYGGVVVPRGTSIVGLDLRKTKIRPKYVPNPTDTNAPNSAIFRVTGACYFWQFSIFDGSESGLVYTDPVDFSSNNRSIPTFSHHKLTCFEYADGVNLPTGYTITDLDMYYSKLSNAFNLASGRDIDQKYPANPLGFSKQRPEWEIVGAFASDPVNISNIISGDGSTPGSIVTVTTSTAHGLTEGTPVKIRGINVDDYNISTKVQTVPSSTTFTYILPFVRDNLPAGASAGLSGSSGTVTIETDTVSGASPYIFNISLRSVWGMNGMHADGSKASGFRSMVVAQFTAVSLQKDDRAFVKYNKQNRVYDAIGISKVTGSALSSGSSSTNLATVYHLDSGAIYRHGWQPVHIKVTNDSFIQIVSVFAIGFNKHFAMESGGDGSITNSNSNFGQFSLSSDGFKKEAFDKDNKAFITSIITPKAVTTEEINIDWISFDVAKTQQVGVSSHLYLFGFNNPDDDPPVITQGYRIGAKVNDSLSVVTPSGTKTASIYMLDNIIGTGTTIALGTQSSEKLYKATSSGSNILTLGTHNIQTGEKIRIISDAGDLPENLTENVIYYAIRHSATEIKVAGSKTNAEAATPIPITIYGGTQLKVVSRVSDKAAGEIGSPIQYDSVNSAWYVHANANNDIYSTINSLGVAGLTARTNVAFIERRDDPRSLDEKLYKVRVVVPRELFNGRDPNEGFVIQESSTTGARSNADFSLGSITSSDYLFNRNPRFISTCTYDSINNLVTVTADLPHNLKVGDQVILKNVTSTTNTAGTLNLGYNGTFVVTEVTNDKVFKYGTTDTLGTVHNPGTFTNNTNTRSVSLPRFERNDLKGNFFVYRREVISQYIYNVQDGVYHVYLLNASNTVPTEFTNLKYSQNVVDLYPQLDKDNVHDNPPASISFAKRDPLGDVVTNDLKNSITRESIDKLFHYFGLSPIVSSIETSVSGITTVTFNKEHQLNGVVTYNTLNGGSGHSNGTYYNVKLYNENTLTNWDGATAKVVVSGVGNSVTSAEIISGGSGYTNGETLWFDSGAIGGSPSARITIATSGISTSVGNSVQFTGLGTVTDGYYRIIDIPAKNKIAIGQTVGDPTIVPGQYFINISPAVSVNSAPTYDSATGIATFTCASSHGLVAGNKFRVLDASHNNLGDFVVNEIASPTVFTSETDKTIPASTKILKHALSGNDATSDSLGENLGTRGVSLYQNEILTLGQTITNETQFIVSVPNSGIGTVARFPLGSYIQVDNEIMRITSSTLAGSGNNEIQVIRGSMGTLKENHTSGVMIRKIKPLPIELRRPSIIRASGHTFEYMGFGPGNYSTGLPQLQNRTLTEREDFLSQSQESSCGNVVYTGMNSDGDFFIGNTKYSASSGEQTTYDIPVPTITGQDPSRLSVVFDEVIVKERIIVEGGNSQQVLSQFDGPVTFNKELKMNDTVAINGALKVNNTQEITNTTQSTNKDTGALIVEGGVGIEKNLNIGGDMTIGGTTQSTTKDTGALVLEGGLGVEKNLNIGGVQTIAGTTESTNKDTGALIVEGGVGIEKNLNIGGNLNVGGTATITGNITANANIRFGDNDHLYLGDGDDLDLYHDGSNSYVDDKGSGSLFLRGNGGVYIQKYTGESMIDAVADGAINLYHDNTVRINTRSDGARVTGEFSATGDVIAFVSDERLKTNIQPLENALDKVLQLSGFTYTFNETAGLLGFNTEETHVGVSAQQVQAVLPEAVKPAPVNGDYITVQYEKIVPLLIEAIKELSAKVDALEKKIG